MHRDIPDAIIFLVVRRGGHAQRWPPEERRSSFWLHGLSDGKDEPVCAASLVWLSDLFFASVHKLE